jgi:hypothetical protein
LPGFAFAYATNSLIDLNGALGLATSARKFRVESATGAKSFSG